jgi:JmjC domain, hydroxylase/Jumonji helical domain
MIPLLINVIVYETSCIHIPLKRKANCSSLEVSSSALGAQVVRPQFVRDLDLIEKIWPRHLRPTSSTSANPNHAAVVLPTATNTPSNITFPKVSLYCLMSVARSYTDFHIDFGGSSVFYHILRGNKTFLFIEPNAANLRRYEAWCLDSEQGNRFLGSEVKECIRVDLSAGDTMIIPSGWIHAVYTPTDSLVLGGNFLTPIHIPSQLNIAAIENRTRVPKKFKFPFFDMAMWYTAIYYIDIYIPRRKRGPIPKSGRKNTEGMCEYEIEGLKILAEWLWKKSKLRTQQLAKGAEFHRAKVEVPPGIDAVETATRYTKWVYDADLPQGDEQKDLPTWYRNEVLLQKVDTPKKRKREDGEVPSVRKYTRRNVKPQQEGGTEVPLTIREIIPSTYDYFSLSRPVTSYSSISYISQPSTNYSADTKFPLITYPPQTNISPSQAFKIFKPYSSQQPSHHTLQPAGESFVAIVKRVCRPYLRPTKPTTLLEEIKVEDGPALEGLGLLSQAVELTTQPNPPNYAPSSTDSTLTIYSPSEVRLPTPPSQSPPPAPPPQFQDPVMRQAALGLRRARSNSDTSSPITTATAPPVKIRKKPGPKPKNRNPDDPFVQGRVITNVSRAPIPRNLTPRRQGRSSGRGLKSLSPIARRIPTRVAVENEEAEARRLQSLLTDDELMEFRKLKRRGNDFIFGVAILKKELERLGRKY